MKFICDHMLGTLAKWLRMLGFDTSFSPPIDDDELLKIAWREQRILITRDKNIGSYKDARILIVGSDDLDEQLDEVIGAFALKITAPMSRCSLCNTPIEEISKEDCRDKVPPGVFENQNRFWYCPGCGKYYWAGSHWEKINEKIERLKKSGQ
jgi:uncharacterized protein with PIN domain